MLDRASQAWEDGDDSVAVCCLSMGLDMARFSEQLMDHFSRPRNSGRLDAPDRVGIAGVPHQGPFTRLELRITGDVIADARFQTHGCGPSIACGSALTELIIGRPLTEARRLSALELEEALGGLPDDKRHCADLAIAALGEALKEALTAEH